jgi:hypothetical protein
MPSPISTVRERQTTYVLEMMERLGIEPGGGAVPRLGLSYSTVFHRCRACESKEACREWIEKGPAAARLAPRFCPNADIFFELQFDLAGRGRACDGSA